MSVSAEAPQPQPGAQTGDTVEVVIKGEVLSTGTGGWMNVAVGAVPGQPQRGVISLPRRGEGVSVEVLERAYDLTYRVGNHNPRNIYLGDEHVGVMFDPEAGPVVVAALNAAVAERRQEQPPPEWELAPGPRPEVRVPNEPHGIPNETREKVAALAAKGDRAGAVRELRQGVIIGFRAAAEYVESMPEFQTYLEQQGGKREPRVFRADQPEPPPDVTVLEDTGPAWGDMQYLVRAGDKWCWSPSREVIGPDHSDPCPWHRAAGFADGPLVEVLS